MKRYVYFALTFQNFLGEIGPDKEKNELVLYSKKNVDIGSMLVNKG